MTTSCAVEAIQAFSIAIVAISGRRRTKQLTLDWLNPEVVKQDLSAFRSRMALMLKAEVAQYLSDAGGEIPDWKGFDLERSLVFPRIFKDHVYQYSGAGQILKYDMHQVKAYLHALKSAKLVEYEKIIDKFNCTSILSIDDCQALEIEYPNGFLLRVRKEQNQVQWYKNGNLERDLQFRAGESPKGLLTALENYSATGEIDEAYGMFMLTPFDLDMEHISFNQRGRLFIQELGI